ncbi:lysis protein [Chromobacterium sp. S0633]|uniref:lysis system i-spanin subunit Rz n=1 Tax=Chromobacterium sp. S0633 TaxID=2957805 RepID=UPI0020A1C29F|nr:lysis system i-spanin subunit Rz [Chromobacterium sp. S0633]MCP1289806.1 lysis protein [Chromobacterium sp. S0633]
MWRKAIPWLVLLGLLVGSHWWAYHQGKDVVTAAWRLADATRERNDSATFNDLQQRLRRQEAKAASQLLAAETNYQESLRHVEAEKNRLLADAVAGRRRLSVPVKAASCSPAGSATYGAGGSADPAPRAELSVEAAGFLVGLAAEADAVAVELNRCVDRVGGLGKRL